MVDYQSKWVDDVQQQKNLIEIALNNAITAIHHIGSTAIPGLCAKPVIDRLIEVADLEANFNLASTHFPQYIPSMHFVRSPQYTLVDSGIDHPDFNYVMDTHLNENHENETIASIITHFRERKRPFTWLVSPFDTPPTLAERLERHQCKHLAPLIAFIVTLVRGTLSSSLRALQSSGE